MDDDYFPIKEFLRILQNTIFYQNNSEKISQNLPIMVKIVSVNNEFAAFIDKHKEHLFNEGECSELRSIYTWNSKNKISQYIISRILLKLLILEYYYYPKSINDLASDKIGLFTHIRLLKDDKGIPGFSIDNSNFPNLNIKKKPNISLSHTLSYIAASISENLHGIDIEEKKIALSEAWKKKYVKLEELSILEEKRKDLIGHWDSVKYFLSWTIKESAFKAFQLKTITEIDKIKICKECGIIVATFKDGNNLKKFKIHILDFKEILCSLAVFD
jgi:phosphopantetheinyl transferase (holo-ACP synthase)